MGGNSEKVGLDFEDGDARTTGVPGKFTPCSAIFDGYKNIDQVNLVGIKDAIRILKLGSDKSCVSE